MGLQSPRESRGGPKGFQRVKGYAYRVPAGEWVGLQGPRGSRGGPTRSLILMWMNEGGSIVMRMVPTSQVHQPTFKSKWVGEPG